MAIDIYEDNAGGIVLVETVSMTGLSIGHVYSNRFGDAEDDCYGLSMSDDIRSDYDTDDLISGETLNATLAQMTLIATWYGRRKITVWNRQLTGSGEPGTAGKIYLGISETA